VEDDSEQKKQELLWRNDLGPDWMAWPDADLLSPNGHFETCSCTLIRGAFSPFIFKNIFHILIV